MQMASKMKLESHPPNDCTSMHLKISSGFLSVP